MLNGQRITPRAVTANLLQNIQFLYQNGEINNITKNELVNLIKKGLTGNVDGLYEKLCSLRYSVTLMGDVVEDSINIIKGLV